MLSQSLYIAIGSFFVPISTSFAKGNGKHLLKGLELIHKVLSRPLDVGISHLDRCLSSNKIDIERLESLARQARGAVIELSGSAEVPHVGSSLSCIDILVAAYWHSLRFNPEKPDDPNRDRLILSKGHAAQALYTVLNMRGLLDVELLKTFNQDGGQLAEHPGPNCAPGVEAATGSLGHGLPIGVGLALAGRVHKRSYRTLVVMSDGECNEGSVWEAALLAAAQKLENLFSGPTAVALSQDAISSAKILTKFSKENQNLKILGGIMGKDILDVAGVAKMATLPTLEEARAKIVGILRSPAQKITSILLAPASKIAILALEKSKK